MGFLSSFRNLRRKVFGLSKQEREYVEALKRERLASRKKALRNLAIGGTVGGGLALAAVGSGAISVKNKKPPIKKPIVSITSL